MVSKLPNAEHAFIDPRKLRDYVLNPRHDTGRFKATFFSQMGYSETDWKVLEHDIKEQLLAEAVEPGKPSPFGQKFTITAILKGPNGESRWVTVVWIIRPDNTWPELVTIEPAQQGNKKAQG